MKPAVANLVDSLAESSESKQALERRLVEMGNGILSALRAGEISFDQARTDLFNMNNLLALRRHRTTPLLRQFFEWAMELEDVAKLAPKGLNESYKKLAQLSEKILASARPRTARAASPSAARRASGSRVRKAG